MKIAIGCDHAGVEHKTEIIRQLQEDGHIIIDCGTHGMDSVDYPDIAEKVATEVLENNILGVILCGTGIGISIAANKVPGIRAALCHNTSTASLARQHNDANIIALGARMTDLESAMEIIRAFLATDFEGGRHQRRIDKITALEQKWREKN